MIQKNKIDNIKSLINNFFINIDIKMNLLEKLEEDNCDYIELIILILQNAIIQDNMKIDEIMNKLNKNLQKKGIKLTNYNN